MRDRVTPELALAVFARDGGCVAPRLGGTYMDCFGRNRIEHVQLGYGRMGRRAPSCLCSLATVCEGHSEPGMRAGYVWCTANREALRGYLAGFGYSPHVKGHLDPHTHVEIVVGCSACDTIRAGQRRRGVA